MFILGGQITSGHGSKHRSAVLMYCAITQNTRPHSGVVRDANVNRCNVLVFIKDPGYGDDVWIISILQIEMHFNCFPS